LLTNRSRLVRTVATEDESLKEAVSPAAYILPELSMATA
jgi:hypothetical protein